MSDYECSSIGIGTAEFCAVAEGRLTENNRVYPIAVFLDGRVLSRYLHYKHRYDDILRINEDHDPDLPATFDQTEYCRNLIAAHGSPVAAAAVRNGNLAVLS